MSDRPSQDTMSDRPAATALQKLVEAERARPDAPEAAKAAARDKLTALLGPAAGLGGGGGVAAPASSRANRIAKLTSAGAAKLAGAFVLGGLVGGALASAVGRPAEPRERIVYVDRAQTPAPPVASIPPVSEPPAPPTSAARAVPSGNGRPHVRAETPPASSSNGPTRNTALSAERALIERARSALARGDGEGALLAAAQHEREFPRGQLAEEREVLAVQALVGSSRAQEAAERGARFRKTYPNSLLLPLVDQVLR